MGLTALSEETNISCLRFIFLAASHKTFVEITLLKEINKLNKRIQFASIFPPSTLVEFELAVRNFDDVQRKEQGSIATKDTFLFPKTVLIYT